MSLLAVLPLLFVPVFVAALLVANWGGRGWLMALGLPLLLAVLTGLGVHIADRLTPPDAPAYSGAFFPFVAILVIGMPLSLIGGGVGALVRMFQRRGARAQAL